MRIENIAYFEGQIDLVHRSSLQPYDDGKRVWIVLTSSKLTLAEVAVVLMEGDPLQFRNWLAQDQIQIYASLSQIHGERFRAIWLEDTYVIQLCWSGHS